MGSSPLPTHKKKPGKNLGNFRLYFLCCNGEAGLHLPSDGIQGLLGKQFFLPRLFLVDLEGTRSSIMKFFGRKLGSKDYNFYVLDNTSIRLSLLVENMYDFNLSPYDLA